MAVATRKKKADPARKKPAGGISNIPLYTNAHAHLLDELRWLNRLIAAQVLNLRRVDFYDGVKNFRDFFVAEEEIDALLTAGIFENNGHLDGKDNSAQATKLLAQANEIRAEIDRRLAETRAQGFGLPLAELAEYFHLEPFETEALTICLAPQIDARYEKLYAYLQDNMARKYPGVELILNLLTQNAEERLHLLPCFDSAAPLLHYGLLENTELGTGTSAAQNFLRVEPRIVQFVLGNQAIDSRLRSLFRFVHPLSWEEVVVPADLQQRLQALFQTMLTGAGIGRTSLYLHGRAGVGKKTIARALCSEMGVPLALVDAGKLLRQPAALTENLRLILREGMLQSCAVYFEWPETFAKSEADSESFFSALAEAINELGWLTIFGSEQPVPETLLDPLDIIDVEIPAPDYAAQKALWGLHLDGLLAENEQPELKQLTANFDLTGGQIARAVRRSVQQARLRDPQNGRVTAADLIAGSRLQSQPMLGKLARKVEPHYTWQDIVLPQETLSQLHEICQWVNHRQRVFDDWGFAGKLSQGKGINALFAGPSGTGKTMAAEIIANALQVDLYKIDLSGVVSKYIGETEKNLDRIFSAAEHANAILFFDEADALFGKRSEVRDSHDRYANIEVSYLLQKMEQYEGLAILATNLRQNLDEAFTRRLAFTVHFPFPDAENRLDIWRGIWPKQTPLADDLDFDTLSREYKFSGGNIKNIALAAAFLAAEDDSSVTMAHLHKAVRREYQKMGKVVKEK